MANNKVVMTAEQLEAQGIPLHLVMSTRDEITSCCQISTREKRPDGSDVWVTSHPGQSTCKGKNR